MNDLTVSIDKKQFIETVSQLLGERATMEIAEAFSDYLKEMRTFKVPDEKTAIIDSTRVMAVVRIDPKYYIGESLLDVRLRVKFPSGYVTNYIKADEKDIKIVKGKNKTQVKVNETCVDKAYFDKACKILSLLYNIKRKRSEYFMFNVFYPKDDPSDPLIVTHGTTAVLIAPLVDDKTFKRRFGWFGQGSANW